MVKRKRRAKTTAEIVSALLALLGHRGAKRRAPNRIVLMRSKAAPVIKPEREEGRAPVLVQFGSSAEPECCDEGIRISLTVSYRGPLRRVRIDPLDRDGKHSMAWHIVSYDETRWDLTDDEQQQAANGSVSHTFSLCVWCEFFTDNHTARFSLNAMQPDGQSIYVVGVTISAKQFQNCC